MKLIWGGGGHKTTAERADKQLNETIENDKTIEKYYMCLGSSKLICIQSGCGGAKQNRKSVGVIRTILFPLVYLWPHLQVICCCIARNYVGK